METTKVRWLAVAQCSVLAVMLGACGGDDDGSGTDGGTHPECTEGASHHEHEANPADAGADADVETDEAEEVGTPSGATCPTDNKLTYDNFGQKFMTDYCVRCHSSELPCEERNGAPLEHDFDDLPGILLVADHIDQKAAAGPDSTNIAMPPDGAKPTLAQRRQLGEWLACEVEKINK